MKPRHLRIAISFDCTPQSGFFLKTDCVDSFRKRDVELLPLVDDCRSIERTLELADGVVIPGGVDDVDPALYGQDKKHQRVRINRRRCDFEFKLLEMALKMEMPLLSICWGVQFLNVFLGGSLIQDVPHERPSNIKHEQAEDPHIPTHWVNFTEGGEAEKLFGTKNLFVNSTHHQAIDRVGKNLVVEGLSEDGLIECVRLEGPPFCWGVQWHPERLEKDPIIPAFLKACSNKTSS